jgi:hypothetical protein
VRKAVGKRWLGRYIHRWKDNIKVNLKEKGWEGVQCIHLAQDRDWWLAFVNMETNLWIL